eukprot:11201955-Lingulodinium_polyedra.AAC.1
MYARTQGAQHMSARASNTAKTTIYTHGRKQQLTSNSNRHNAKGNMKNNVSAMVLMDNEQVIWGNRRAIH